LLFGAESIKNYGFGAEKQKIEKRKKNDYK
jgi:hypothetical protein